MEFRSPGELEEAVAEFVHWYNHVHYHERIGNLHPVDAYQGRGEEIHARRKQAKADTLAMRRLANRRPLAVEDDTQLGGRDECDGDRTRQTPLKKAPSAPDTGIMADESVLGQMRTV